MGRKRGDSLVESCRGPFWRKRIQGLSTSHPGLVRDRLTCAALAFLTFVAMTMAPILRLSTFDSGHGPCRFLRPAFHQNRLPETAYTLDGTETVDSSAEVEFDHPSLPWWLAQTGPFARRAAIAPVRIASRWNPADSVLDLSPLPLRC